jgi:hypothetical protein
MTFLVQVGKGSKGSYTTRYSFDNFNEAWFWYKSINIGMGYKKRLVKIFEDGTRKTMTRSS